MVSARCAGARVHNATLPHQNLKQRGLLSEKKERKLLTRSLGDFGLDRLAMRESYGRGSDDGNSSDGAVCDLDTDDDDDERSDASEGEDGEERPKGAAAENEGASGSGAEEEGAGGSVLDAEDHRAIQRRIHEQIGRTAAAAAKRKSSQNAHKKGSGKGRRNGKKAAADPFAGM